MNIVAEITTSRGTYKIELNSINRFTVWKVRGENLTRCGGYESLELARGSVEEKQRKAESKTMFYASPFAKEMQDAFELRFKGRAGSAE